jgi:hypothetical protein
MVRDQMKKPQHVFASSDSLWAFYNYVTVALQKSHPKTWMEDQRILHFFISTIGNFQTTQRPQVAAPQIATPVTVPVVENNTNEDTEEFVDPNQISIYDEIASREADAADLDSFEKELTEAEPERLTDDEIVDQLYGVDNNPEVVFDLEDDDESPVYDEDQIKERIAEDEAAVAEVCDPKTDGDEDHIDGVDELPDVKTEPTVVEDEFAEEDNFSLDFNESTNEDQDNTPDFF